MSMMANKLAPKLAKRGLRAPVQVLTTVYGTFIGRWYVTVLGIVFIWRASRHLGWRNTAPHVVAAVGVGALVGLLSWLTRREPDQRVARVRDHPHLVAITTYASQLGWLSIVALVVGADDDRFDAFRSPQPAFGIRIRGAFLHWRRPGPPGGTGGGLRGVGSLARLRRRWRGEDSTLDPRAPDLLSSGRLPAMTMQAAPAVPDLGGAWRE